MTKDKNASVIGLKTARIIPRAIGFLLSFDLQRPPSFSGVAGPVCAGCGDVQDRAVRCREQLRMARMFEGRRTIVIEAPFPVAALEQTLPASLFGRLLGIAAAKDTEEVAARQRSAVPLVPRARL